LLPQRQRCWAFDVLAQIFQMMKTWYLPVRWQSGGIVSAASLTL
jgi:hypothetical protein